MQTARDICIQALRIGGVVGWEDNDINSDNVTRALSVLNNIVDQFKTLSLWAPYSVFTEFPLVQGQTTYTIGIGANINIERPEVVIGLQVYDGYCWLAVDKVSDVGTISDSDPIGYFYDGAFPIGNIVFNREYQFQKARILTEKTIDAFQLDDVISLPAGYASTLINQTASILASQVGAPNYLEIKDVADTMLKRLINSKAKPLGATLCNPFTTTAQVDILTLR